MRSVKHAKFVHQSEVRKSGLQILKDVYWTVLKSDDKDLWREAIASLHRHIDRLEHEVRIAAVNDAEDANAMIVNLWAWKSARRQMYSRFGNRFIHSSPHFHDQGTRKPL